MRLCLPGEKPLISFFGDDHGILKIKCSRGDLTLERFFVGAFEAQEGFGADGVDSLIPIFYRREVLFSSGFDAREAEFFAHDLSEFFESQVDFGEMGAGLVTCFAFAALFAFPLPVPLEVHYGDPMIFEGTGSEDDEVIGGYVEQVRARIAELIEVGRAQREGRSPRSSPSIDGGAR